MARNFGDYLPLYMLLSADSVFSFQAVNSYGFHENHLLDKSR